MTTLMIAAAMNFVTVDPGHFHAALVQKMSYPEVAEEVKVFAPGGADLEAYLKLVESFNTRAENPTAWKEDVYRGDDYLAKFAAAAKAGELGANPIAIFSGRNDRKGDYALAAVEAGVNVLSDKPMAITPEVFAKTERAARLAEKKGLFFADIMTERNEITTILQRALTQDRDLYGEQEKGTPDDPAVTKISVHHFCKLVNGMPLKRPEWFYDTNVQGEGLTDVTTHLVDLVQWETFPGVRLSKGDVKVLSARTWPTLLTPEQFKTSTGGACAETKAVNANGEFTWQLRGVNCKVSVVWNFMAPKGTGDTHYSLMRGTKAEVVIRQGPEEGYRPVLYVRSRGDAAATGAALEAALARIAADWPGVAAAPTAEAGVWRITYPKKYDVGHEAHFSQVVRTFLGWMKAGREDPLYVDNMLVKYHTIVEAWKLAQAPATRVGIIGCDTSHAIAFARVMNVDRPDFARGFRVTAAHKWGSKDIASSTNRYEKYIAQLKDMGVEMCETVDDLLAKVDVVCLETNDGREHLWQAEKCFKAKKRVFIDKPIAQDYPHAKAICDLGRKYGAEYFSTSTLRYADANAAARAGGTNFTSCIFFAPSPLETQGTHSRYVWYGIHAFETAMTVMGRGAKSVRAYTAGVNDFVTITWADGRVANLKLDQKSWNYGGFAFPAKGEPVPLCGPKGYEPMLKGAILPFFRTGVAPVPHEETLEIFAIMDAAAKSHAEGGRDVPLAEIRGE